MRYENRQPLYRALIMAAVYATVILAMAGCSAEMEARRERAFMITDEAYTKFWGRNWQRVIDLCTKAIEIDKDFPWPYSVRGAAYSAMGKPEAAIPDLNRAIELSPDFAPAFTNRGLAYLKMHEYGNARDDLLEAVKLDPGDLVGLVGLAEVYAATDADEQVCDTLMDALREGFDDLQIVTDRPNFRDFVKTPCFNQLQSILGEMKLQERADQESEEGADGPEGAE